MKNVIVLLFVFIFALYPVKALFHSGFYTSHDGEHQVVRLSRFVESVNDGQIMPRWAKNLDNGFGYPLFNFTYHFPFLLGLPFIYLGFTLVDSVKGVFVLGYLFSGLFMYLWLKERFGKLGAFFGAFLYLWAPYRFSNIFVRAALGEATIFMFLPLLFWGIDKSIIGKISRWGILLTAFGLAGIILSHLMGLIIIALALALWVIINFYCFHFTRANLLPSVRFYFLSLSNLAGGLLLGIGLSSYYLFPAILEKDFTKAGQLLTSHYRDHFVEFSQLLYSKWGYGFDLPGSVNDAMSFQIGFSQWLIILFCFLALILFIFNSFLYKSKIKRLSRDLFILSTVLTIFGFSVFMMLPISSFVWEQIVRYGYFDFPWRFLGLSVFISSFSGALLVSLLKKEPFSPLGDKIVLFLLVLIIPLSLFSNRNHLRVNQYFSISDANYYQNLNTTNQFDEYRPKNLNIDYLKTRRPRFETDLKKVTITNIISKTQILAVSGFSSKESNATINISYFPGWEIRINGKKQSDIVSPEGMLQVKIPKGNFNLKAQFTNTPVRKIANICSIISILIILFIICLPLFYQLPITNPSLASKKIKKKEDRFNNHNLI